jgi:hypothetical protein
MNSKFVINILFLSFFYITTSETIFKFLNINIFSGSRHLILLLSFLLCYFIYNRPIYFNKIYLLLISLLCFISFSGLLSDYSSISKFLYGFILSFVFIPIFILAYSIKIKQKYFYSLISYILYFILLSTFYAVFNSILLNENLRFVKTIFREAGAFAAIMNIGIIISLFLFFSTRKRKYLFFAVFLTACILNTFLKKSILASLITWILFFYYYSNIGKIKYILIGISVPIIIVFFLNLINISNNIAATVEYTSDNGPNDDVRISMYIASFKLASDYFPFGSGLGTFASVPSIYNGYSKVFDDYGISSIPSNSYSAVLEESHTILDTFWPHILGELGFLCFILYLIVYSYPIILIKKIGFSNNLNITSYKYFITALILTSILQGFFLYIPEIPTFIFINSGLIGLIFNFLNSDLSET